MAGVNSINFPELYTQKNFARKISKNRERLTQYIKSGNEIKANELWFHGAYYDLGTKYVEAFKSLKNKSYYDAWCEFEQCEIILESIENNTDDIAPWANLIKGIIANYNLLYPYHHFFSPGFVASEKKCSICGKRITIRNKCQHQVGKLYCGQLCHRVITKSKFKEISLVTKPVQKYSVAFLDRDKNGWQDQHDYTLLQNIVNVLEDPFEPWSVIVTTKLYSLEDLMIDETSNIKCPCNSGKSYNDCCQGKVEIEIPHYKFILTKNSTKIQNKLFLKR